MRFNWIWKSLIAGACGSAAQTTLMLLKSRTGLLPGFEPYETLRVAMSQLVGGQVAPVVPWLLSFLNGSTVIGLLFGRLFHRLPGRSGLAKGFILGLAGWLLIGTLLFPALGYGLFARSAGHGLLPAVASFAMIQIYSLVLGLVYAAMERRWPSKAPPQDSGT
jgi:hypothetical protein